MASLNFNANDVEPVGDYTPLPIGSYTVIISATEIKDTKNKTGQYLQFVYSVVDGEHQGRLLFDRLNIKNENVTAQEIAQRALSSICRAVGVMHPKDSDELKNIPFVVKVGIRAASGEYPASNIVKSYERVDGKKLTEIVDTPTTTTTAPKKALPWDKAKK
jgi:hypothetical protein